MRASVKVAARGDGAAIPVPVPGRSFFHMREPWDQAIFSYFGTFLGKVSPRKYMRIQGFEFLGCFFNKK